MFQHISAKTWRLTPVWTCSAHTCALQMAVKAAFLQAFMTRRCCSGWLRFSISPSEFFLFCVLLRISNIYHYAPKAVRRSIFFQIFTASVLLRWSYVEMYQVVKSFKMLHLTTLFFCLWPIGEVSLLSLPLTYTEPLMGWVMRAFNLPFVVYCDTIKLLTQTKVMFSIFFAWIIR